MTLTETRALGLVSNPEAVAAVPELAPLFEEFMALKRSAEAKESCRRCKISDPTFYPVRDKVLGFILGLSGDAHDRIKRFLVTKKLVVVRTIGGVRTKTEI